MKNIHPFLFFLLGILFLTGCQQVPLEKEQVLTEEKKQTNTNTQTTFDCSIPHYYENIKLEKQVSFTRNKDQEAYVAEVPELCVRFISKAPKDEATPKKRKALVNTHFKKLLHLNVINNEVFLGGIKNAHYIFEDKSNENLQEAVNEKYFLGILDEEAALFQGESYCKVGKDRSLIQEKSLYVRAHIAGESDDTVQYSITTPYQIAKKHNLQPLKVYSQLCDTKFPYQDIGFGVNIPYDILYTENYPSRYVIYGLHAGHETSAPIMNIILEYLD